MIISIKKVDHQKVLKNDDELEAEWEVAHADEIIKFWVT